MNNKNELIENKENCKNCKNCRSEIKKNEITKQGYCSNCLRRVGVAIGNIRK